MNKQWIDQAIIDQKAFGLQGIENATVQQMQSRVGVTFPEDYATFLKHYGALSVNSHEIFGHAPGSHMDVVENTLQERERTEGLGQFVVIENTGFDGILLVMDESSRIYEYDTKTLIAIHASFEDFLNSLVQ